MTALRGCSPRVAVTRRTGYGNLALELLSVGGGAEGFPASPDRRIGRPTADGAVKRSRVRCLGGLALTRRATHASAAGPGRAPE